MDVVRRAETWIIRLNARQHTVFQSSLLGGGMGNPRDRASHLRRAFNQTHKARCST